MLLHAHMMLSSSCEHLIFSDTNMTQMDMRTQLLTQSLSALLFLAVTWSCSTKSFLLNYMQLPGWKASESFICPACRPRSSWNQLLDPSWCGGGWYHCTAFLRILACLESAIRDLQGITACVSAYCSKQTATVRLRLPGASEQHCPFLSSRTN